VNDIATAPKTTLTLAQKIANTEKLLAKYKQELLTEALQSNIEIGDDVDFTFGRADAKRTLTGKVQVGITEDDKGYGKVVGVFAGEGFDQKVYKVRIADITANRTADQRNAANPAEPAAETDPLSVN
jgi:hypothetical protein